jgi:hypothetical protein
LIGEKVEPNWYEEIRNESKLIEERLNGKLLGIV